MLALPKLSGGERANKKKTWQNDDSGRNVLAFLLAMTVS